MNVLLLLAAAWAVSQRKGAAPSSGARKPQTTPRAAAEQRAIEQARAAVSDLAPIATTAPATPAKSPDPVQAAVTQLTPTRTPALSPKDTAKALRLHLKRTRSFGSKGEPDAIVRQAQIDMGVTPADGIVGPSTRARAKALGVTLPLRGAR